MIGYSKTCSCFGNTMDANPAGESLLTPVNDLANTV
jgi:hypothetical protein